MSTQDCIFCKIAAGQIHSNKVYEDDSVFAFLDIAPLSEGHTLVIPKSHFETLDQCPADVLSDVAMCAGKVASAVVSALGCEGYNVLCNNGKVAGQEVGHMHFHIIPRNRVDGIFTQWPSKEYSEGVAEAVVNKIREKL